MDTLFDITIAVLTRNSDKTLKFCLDAILSQCKSSYQVELLVLDNGSTDSTHEILKFYGINAVHLPEFNIPKLRNYAVYLSKSEIIGFVDSDCVIGQKWISQVLQILKNPEISGTGYRYSLPEKRTWLESKWYFNNKNEKTEQQLIPAGNFAFKKSAFYSIGGYDEQLVTGEDADFLERAKESGIKIVSEPCLINYHLGFPKSLIEFYKKEKWYGEGTKLKYVINGHDKPSLAAIIFFLCILFSLWNFFLLKLKLAITGIFFCFCICVGAAVHRKYMNGVGSGLLSMTFIYIIYFLARINALIENVIIYYFRKKK